MNNRFNKPKDLNLALNILCNKILDAYTKNQVIPPVLRTALRKKIRISKKIKYCRVYISLNNQTESLWGFVVIDKKHKRYNYGDILEATWSESPAPDSIPRGNIFGGYSVRWNNPQTLIDMEDDKENTISELRRMAKRIY